MFYEAARVGDVDRRGGTRGRPGEVVGEHAILARIGGAHLGNRVSGGGGAGDLLAVVEPLEFERPGALGLHGERQRGAGGHAQSGGRRSGDARIFRARDPEGNFTQCNRDCADSCGVLMAAQVIHGGGEFNFLVRREVGGWLPEYAVRRSVIDAEQFILAGARGARHRKGHLGHAIAAGDLGAELAAAREDQAVQFARGETELRTGGGRDECNVRGRGRRGQRGGGAPDGKLQRRDGDAHRAVGVNRERFFAGGVRRARIEEVLERRAAGLAGGDGGGQRGGAGIVERDDIFHQFAALDAREGEQARLGGGARQHRAGAQRGMRGAQCAELGKELVERMRRIELVVGAGAGGGEQRGGGVGGRARREHVLAGLLVVAAAADHALFVAIMEHRHAAGEVKQAMAELGQVGDLREGGAGIVLLEKIAEAADVVIAEESDAGVDVAVVVGVRVVAVKKISERGGAAALRDKFPGGGGEGEIGGGVAGNGAGGKLAEVGDVARFVHHLAKLEKIRAAERAGLGADSGEKSLPEGGIDVAHRVDAETVHTPAEPLAEDGDEALYDARVLREDVVEADEVAEDGVLAGEGAVAAVVVEGDIVQPRGIFRVLLAAREDGHIGEAGFGGEEGKRGGIVQAVVGDGALVEGFSAGVAIRREGFVAVVEFTAFVADDVAGVVHDDVEVNLHAAGMGLADKLAKFVVGAEVRIDVQKIQDPVTMVAG